MAVLDVAGLRKVFGHGDESRRGSHPHRPAHRGWRSGSGKSTLLLRVSMIVEPTAGRIRVNDQDVFVDGTSRVNARRYRRENIGFIFFQSHNLIPFLNARDNVAIAGLNGVGSREARRRAMALLD